MAKDEDKKKTLKDYKRKNGYQKTKLAYYDAVRERRFTIIRLICAIVGISRKDFYHFFHIWESMRTAKSPTKSGKYNTHRNFNWVPESF